jgi:hypothetical protein
MANTVTVGDGQRFVTISKIASDWDWRTTFPDYINGIRVRSIQFIPSAPTDVMVLRDAAAHRDDIHELYLTAAGAFVPNDIGLTIADDNVTIGPLLAYDNTAPERAWIRDDRAQWVTIASNSNIDASPGGTQNRIASLVPDGSTRVGVAPGPEVFYNASPANFPTGYFNGRRLKLMLMVTDTTISSPLNAKVIIDLGGFEE